MKNTKFAKLLLSLSISFCMVLMTACGSGVSIPDEYNYDDFSEFIKLANYKGVEYTPEIAEVSQDEIDKYIDDQLKQSATESKKITSGVAKADSIANINYIGRMDGVAFEGGTGDNYDLDLANSTFIDGFAEEIIGHSVGETFDVNVTFPEDYGSADLAGKPAVFETTINYLTEKVTPEYNLDYVKKNTEYDSIEAYEDSIREKLLADKESQLTYKNQEKVFNMIVKDSKVIKYPDEEYKLRLEALGTEKKAKQKVKEELVLHAIAQAEGMKFTDSDYQEYLDNLLSQAGMTAESFEESQGMSIGDYAEQYGMFTSFLFGKVMDKVMEYSIEK